MFEELNVYEPNQKNIVKFICSFSGSNRYRILPLHSQIPREEQRKVFEPVPDNVTKVRFSRMEKYRVDFVSKIQTVNTSHRTDDRT